MGVGDSDGCGRSGVGCRIAHRVRLPLLGVLLLTSGCAGATRSFGNELDSYYRSVLSGDGAAAYGLLCAHTRAELPDPGALLRAANAQRGALSLTGKYFFLRGDDNLGEAVFSKRHDDDATLEMPVEWHAGRPTFCPSAESPFGNVTDE